MWFARQPDDGAPLAAQHDPAARDAQRSRDLVFAGLPAPPRLLRCRVPPGCAPCCRRPSGVSRWARDGRRQFHTARPISRRGEIHDAISAGIVPVVQAMVRAAEGPLANRLRMQRARGEHAESNLHNLILVGAHPVTVEAVESCGTTDGWNGEAKHVGQMRCSRVWRRIAPTGRFRPAMRLMGHWTL